MRKISIVFLTLISMSGFKVQAYEPAGDRIMTKWGEDIDPSSVWEEYPRPIMERSEPERSLGICHYRKGCHSSERLAGRDTCAVLCRIVTLRSREK